MASVSSLDKDMRKLRMDKYTPAAAKETRDWVEDVLGETMKPGDLIEALKDGVALCQLVNIVLPSPGIRFKASAMPFVQMENISHFLRACQSPPINLQPHDVFLTVDLYESKDPAQVLQCLSAFSRVANQLEPSRFPTAIGPKARGGLMSPQSTGSGAVGGGSYGSRGRGISNASNTSSAYNQNSRAMGTVTPTKTGDSNGGRWSPTKNLQVGALSPGTGGVSSWSKKSDEASTSPAWNINQYGYMGGASQGNMGISFGGRRQITSAGPHVPNLAEKEKRRKEQAAEEERLRQEKEEYDRQQQQERDAEEERARAAEEHRWAEETRKLREQELIKVQEEKQKWEDEERRWKLEEERRQEEEREAEAILEKERRRGRGNSDARLQGQFLSQYQAEQGLNHGNSGNGNSSRIQELEVELARERERQYEREREERKIARNQARQLVEDHDLTMRIKEEGEKDDKKPHREERSRSKSRARSRSRPAIPERKSSDEHWRSAERDYLRQQWDQQHPGENPPSKSPRPLPDPAPPVRVKTNHTGPSSRPLPDPTAYAPPSKETYSTSGPAQPTRTDRYLSSNPAPQAAAPKTTYASELGGFDSVSERDAEDRRRQQSQTKTKAGGWASKSLLEREMEMERQRQQEWEQEQKASAARVPSGRGVDGIGGGLEGKFDQSQWTGYTRGDGQNRGSQGIGAGRRQIVGPRPPPPGR